VADLRLTEHPIADCPDPDSHCCWHDVDEPQGGYRTCFECWHVYQTAAELLAEHNKVLASLGLPPETDVERVHCCPFCTHSW
jgi:hypothetical protein